MTENNLTLPEADVAVCNVTVNLVHQNSFVFRFYNKVNLYSSRFSH